MRLLRGENGKVGAQLGPSVRHPTALNVVLLRPSHLSEDLANARRQKHRNVNPPVSRHFATTSSHAKIRELFVALRAFDRPRRKYRRVSPRDEALGTARPAPAMASAAATPTAYTARGFERVAARRSARPRGRSGFPDRGPVRVVCRTTRFSEQFGDAGAPKPGTLQSPPLYVKRTLRGGQTVRHPGTVIVRHVSRFSFPTPSRRARAARPTSDVPDRCASSRLDSRRFLRLDFFSPRPRRLSDTRRTRKRRFSAT